MPTFADLERVMTVLYPADRDFAEKSQNLPDEPASLLLIPFEDTLGVPDFYKIVADSDRLLSDWAVTTSDGKCVCWENLVATIEAQITRYIAVKAPTPDKKSYSLMIYNSRQGKENVGGLG